MTLVRKLTVSMLAAIATTSVGATQPTPATPATPVTYRGPVSFGGTVAITVDAPTTGKVQVRFDDSPAGFGGTIIGSYSVSHGEYVVRQFTADGAEPPPEAFATRLRRVVLRFSRHEDKLSGSISSLPDLATVSGLNTRMAGVVHASSTSELPALASIAGTYTYVRQQDTSEQSLRPGQAARLALDSGQLRIDRTGAMWLCSSKDCLSPASSAVQKLEPADQTRWPGAFAITTDGKPAGRLYLSGKPGDLTLYAGTTTRDSSGAGLGNVVMRTAERVPATPPTGRWRCQHPAMRLDPQTGNYSGRGWLQTDTLDMSGPSVRSRGVQRPLQLSSDTAPAPVSSSTSGEAHELYGVRWAPQQHQAFLPLDATTMAYLLHSGGASSPLDQLGVCLRQRESTSRGRGRGTRSERRERGERGERRGSGAVRAEARQQ